MSTTIGITEMLDNFESSLNSLRFNHKGCDSHGMNNRQNPATGEQEFKCSCGLEIVLPEFGPAIREIWNVAIDQQFRTLAAGTYYCNAEGSITVEGICGPSCN